MIALDLFAGTGWGVACQKLGIEEYGVEIMPEAIATRELNGMTTIYNDVWDGLKDEDHIHMMSEITADYDLLIASPPCQTFSMAGGGAGRKALDDVLGLIDAKAYRSVEDLRAFGESHDPRTALVLTPLAHVYRDLPRYVVFEQVPPVLPVWERCAEEMRAWGYSVWTGNLQAEMYGVPQTRKRAILIAKRDPDLDGEAAPPVPTHSRYYSRDPKRLDEGVLPWVSMAEALGWGMTERPFIMAGNAVGRAEGVGGSGGKAAIVGAKERGAWAHAGAGSAAEKTSGQIPRPDDSPAYTVTGAGNGVWVPADRPRIMRSNYSGSGAPGATAAERGRTLREDDKPSLAMTGKPGHWVRPSFTVTGGGTGSTGGAEPFGSRARASMPEGSTRVTVAEAAALQSYPSGFRWDVEVTKERFTRVWDRHRDPSDPDDEGEYHFESRGIQTKPITKTKQFLQVGNAVPPLLAEAILRAVIS